MTVIALSPGAPNVFDGAAPDRVVVNDVATPDATSQYCVFPEVALSTLAEVGASLGARVVDGSTTHDQSLRLMNAVLGGKASGLAGTSAVYRDLADTKNRVSATVDASGNRTAVTRDMT